MARHRNTPTWLSMGLAALAALPATGGCVGDVGRANPVGTTGGPGDSASVSGNGVIVPVGSQVEVLDGGVTLVTLPDGGTRTLPPNADGGAVVVQVGDAGGPPAVDSGSPLAPGDAGPDAGPDAAADADAAPDAGGEVDAGPPAPYCGDGLRNGTEACEGAQLGGATCQSRGFFAGTLSCAGCALVETACHDCGDGVIDSGDGEQCDGSAIGGASCQSLASKPLGSVTCSSACNYVTTGCYSPDDGDGDNVPDDLDPAPGDFKRCGDSDSDGCDDCSLDGEQNVANDGWDSNGDGQCELALDYDCMNGANAASDPDRLEACKSLTLVNNDRAHFSAEAGGAGPLPWDEDLWEVAYAHSMDMCLSGFFAHKNLSGQDPWDRTTAAGLGGNVSENISAAASAETSQYGFMNEPTCIGHRGAILDPSATKVGIGYFTCAGQPSPANYDWRNNDHMTQLFEIDWSVPASAYCMSNSCELPANPPSLAVCGQPYEGWGWCDPPAASMLVEWECN